MAEKQKRQHACRGARALTLTEGVLCGPGAVLTAAAAEGLALSGVRAARLLAEEEPRTSSHAGASVPWVLHRTTAERGRAGAFGAFELVAGSAQEAVDQCLVAHATRLAGELLVEPAFARRLVLFETLDAAVTAPLLEEAAAREHLVVDDEGVSRELAAAFAAASERLGRTVGALGSSGSADAELVLVTTADARELVLGAAQALGKCRVVWLTQIRPFPGKALAALGRGKRALLLEPAWARGRMEFLVREALSMDGSPLSVVDPHVPNLRAALATALGLGGPASESQAPEPPRCVLGIVPAGPRSEALLCDVAARLSEALPVAIAEPEATNAAVSLLAVGNGRVSARPASSLDVLFVADPVLLPGAKLAERLKQGGSLIFTSAARSADQAWSELGAVERETIRERGARVLWMPAPTSSPDAPDAAWLGLARALVEGSAQALGASIGLDERRIRELGPGPLLQSVDTSKAVPAPTPRTLPERPLLPAAPAKPDAGWRARLRRFHVTGQGAAGPTALLPLAPASVSAWLRGAPAREPLLFVDEDASRKVVPLAEIFAAALGGEPGVLSEHLARITQAVADELSEAGGRAPAGAAFDRALGRFAAKFELSDAARKSFDAALSTFREALPKRGTLLGVGSHTHLCLYASVVLAERAERTAQFFGELEAVASELSERLRLEATRSASARSAEGLSAVLGEGAELFDPAALAKSLPRSRGPQALAEDRRQRMQRSLGVLRRFIDDARKAQKLTLVHSGGVPDALELGRVERVRHPDGFEVAAGLFDGLAERMAEVFRALRQARLELEGSYDPALHDAALAALDWRGFTQDELLLVPPVVVIESAERIWASALGSLSRLLRSGRPIHVIVEESSSLSGQPGLGYLLVAHREAFVVQSTLARPEHLSQGFARMARALRPAVAVVAPRPTAGLMPAWLELGATLEGRALPAFSYDPDAGGSWAECFDIRENPASDDPWPVRRLDVAQSDGTPGSLEVPLTFADAAALDVNLRAHFWPIPSEAWNDDQLELWRWVELPSRELTQRLPFLWVVGDDGRLARAVVSRELAFACRERLRIWRVIQELGGSANEHARRAAERARGEARVEADARISELEAAHAAELERVRNEEASEALSKLARALLDPGGLPRAAAPPPAARAMEVSPSTTAAAPPIAAAPEPAPEEEAVSFSDPYLDTPLCTSCNECVNLNGLMFKYNADKQAILADAKAGTYLQLVTAAEKCPATCIHPGVPRAGDKTVNDDLVARAARFN